MSHPSSPVLKARRQSRRLYSKMLYSLLALFGLVWLGRTVMHSIGSSHHSGRSTAGIRGSNLADVEHDHLISSSSFPAVAPAPQNTTALTLILPVTASSIANLDYHIYSLLRTPRTLSHVVLLSSRASQPQIRKTLRTILSTSDAIDLEFTIHDWHEAVEESVAVMQSAQLAPTDWVLLADHDGLMNIDPGTRSILLLNASPRALLPFGPRGLQYHLDGVSCLSVSSEPQNAAYLVPPMVLPTALLPPSSDSALLRDPWSSIGAYISRSGLGLPGGVVVGSPASSSGWCSLYKAKDPKGGTLPVYMPSGSSTSEAQDSTLPSSNDVHPPVDPGTFLLVVQHDDARHATTLACALARQGHSVFLLASYNDLNASPAITTLEDCGCTVITGPSSSSTPVGSGQEYEHLLLQLPPTLDVVILGDPEEYFPAPFLDQLTGADRSTTTIRIPREDLPFSDWMAAVGIEGWKHWHDPAIELSVITDSRPNSLRRLLASLTAARFYGDTVDLRINVEQTADEATLRIVSDYEWSHGDTFLHHRVVHGGLMTAVVESWYPQDNHSYGLILEDDVELSPLFYAWAKMALLQYRYGKAEDRSPNLFGISLYQQKNLELHPEGRHLFDARIVFTDAGLSHPNTPYLSQIPCSWGALYFPEHWREFHAYLVARLASAAFPLSEPVVPAVRSNRWTRSWKKFFIELVHLRGYVMLYPNYAGFASLSTNHLETGSHVKEMRPDAYVRKKKLFTVPLMPLPPAGEDEGEDVSTTPPNTGLLELPDSRMPEWRELPVLDLLGAIVDAEGLERRGRERRTEMTGCDGLFTEPFDVQELLCIH